MSFIRRLPSGRQFHKSNDGNVGNLKALLLELSRLVLPGASTVSISLQIGSIDTDEIQSPLSAPWSPPGTLSDQATFAAVALAIIFDKSSKNPIAPWPSFPTGVTCMVIKFFQKDTGAQIWGEVPAPGLAMNLYKPLSLLPRIKGSPRPLSRGRT